MFWIQKQRLMFPPLRKLLTDFWPSKMKEDNLIVLPNGDYQLNPEAFCPLTFYNVSMDIVHYMRSLFEGMVSAPDIISKLTIIFQTRQVGIREIDSLFRGGESCFLQSGLNLKRILSLNEAEAKAELFFYAYASFYFRYKTIKRAEEAYKYNAIEGLEYNKFDCRLPECQERHGKVFSVEEAKRIKFKPGCRCDLLPYNSRWK